MEFIAIIGIYHLLTQPEDDRFSLGLAEHAVEPTFLGNPSQDFPSKGMLAYPPIMREGFWWGR